VFRQTFVIGVAELGNLAFSAVKNCHAKVFEIAVFSDLLRNREEQ
jgi:hypothetical protein